MRPRFLTGSIPHILATLRTIYLVDNALVVNYEHMKHMKLVLGIIILVAVALLAWFFLSKEPVPTDVSEEMATTTEDGAPVTSHPQVPSTPTTPAPVPADGSSTVLGTSRDGVAITAYHYGEGEREVLVIGGIHGGYSANTVLTARSMMSWLDASPDAIPDNVRVTVVPLMNPDGLKKVVGTTGTFTSADIPTGNRSEGRFNANGVDLNRNFACEWSATGMWQNRQVSGGDEPFSEPESAALQNYIERVKPQAVVIYYSAAGEVFGSLCGGMPVLKQTRDMTNEYAKAAGYTPYDKFAYYEINGDMANWVASLGVPAISVLLTNHTDPEWTKNQRGMESVMTYVSRDINPQP